MAVGNDTLGTLLPVSGVRVGTVAAGIKVPGRPDLVLMDLAPGTQTAAVFTRNAFCAAPVQIAKAHMGRISPRYLLINTGNANAGTGDEGLAAARACLAAVSQATGVPAEAILPFSTGVIGEALPVDVIAQAVPAAFAALSDSGWEDAATGIMTTDTRPKGHSVEFECDGQRCVVTGIAKGAGMLRPNMATMLAFVATDAAVAQPLLQDILTDISERTFNRITVDGDTSTNDACVLAATGAAKNAVIDVVDSASYQALYEAVEAVCLFLAQALVRDAEGASKFVAVQVTGGRDEPECLEVAYTIAHSPLVKTALFASDPNWGRLLMAIGRADVEALDVEKISVYLNEVLIAEGGCRAASYTEEAGVAAMAPEDITIRVELQRGDAQSTVWTSDFSYDYVRINAEYRT